MPRLLALVALLALTGCYARTPRPPNPPLDFDVLLYGGGVASYAFARSLAVWAPEVRVLIVVPEDRLGEEATCGARSTWVGVPSQDEIGRSLAALGAPHYDPIRMADAMRRTLEALPGVVVWRMRDVESLHKRDGRIVAVEIARMRNGHDTVSRYSGPESPRATVRARVFVDLSRFGRLASRAGAPEAQPVRLEYGFFVSHVEASGTFEVGAGRVRIDRVRAGVSAVLGPTMDGVHPARLYRDARPNGPPFGPDDALVFLRTEVTMTAFQDAFGALPGCARFRIVELPPMATRADAPAPVEGLGEMWSAMRSAGGASNLVWARGPAPSPNAWEVRVGCVAAAMALELLPGEARRDALPVAIPPSARERLAALAVGR